MGQQFERTNIFHLINIMFLHTYMDLSLSLCLSLYLYAFILIFVVVICIECIETGAGYLSDEIAFESKLVASNHQATSRNATLICMLSRD